jgi:O-antigen ligase
LAEASRSPLFGHGYGTRQTGIDNPLRNAPILDNQWLNLLLDVGIIGTAGWAALIIIACRRLGRASRRRAGPDGWLAAGLSASIVGFGVGMFTHDSLSFTQLAFVFWIVLALAASLLLSDAEVGQFDDRSSSTDAQPLDQAVAFKRIRPREPDRGQEVISN